MLRWIQHYGLPYNLLQTNVCTVLSSFISLPYPGFPSTTVRFPSTTGTVPGPSRWVGVDRPPSWDCTWTGSLCVFITHQNLVCAIGSRQNNRSTDLKSFLPFLFICGSVGPGPVSVTSHRPTMVFLGKTHMVTPRSRILVLSSDDHRLIFVLVTWDSLKTIWDVHGCHKGMFTDKVLPLSNGGEKSNLKSSRSVRLVT
jgi:hypothetical protein